MEDAKLLGDKVRATQSGCHRTAATSNSIGVLMTRMVMMWLFGVPVSVLLLFMVFGVV